MDNSLKQDLQRALLNADEFGEQVTYTPKGGTAKTVVALVTRKPIAPSDQNRMRSPRRQCELRIANGSAGVTFVNKGDDRVRFAEYPGGTAVDWVVEEVVGVSEVMWHVRVGR